MGDVVNLKRFRKRAERGASAKEADANRARFGRTKSERAQEQQRERTRQGIAGSASARRRRRVMKSPVVKRSIVVAGHKTSVSLEEAFWNGMKEISGTARHDTVGTGRRDRQQPPAGQPVVGDPAVRARLLPHACHRRQRRHGVAAASLTVALGCWRSLVSSRDARRVKVVSAGLAQ